MLLIILNWLIVFTLCFFPGKYISDLLSKQNSLSISIICGLALYACILCLIAFFNPLQNIITYIIIGIVFGWSVWHFIKNRKQIIAPRLNIFLPYFILCVYYAWLSAGPSLINDDGLYYRQTIQWLSNYGWIHGISNIHLALGNGSAWLILQSFFSFEKYFGIGIFDLNGFFICIYILFVIETTTQRISIKRFILCFIPSILAIAFISGPNTDFPLLILALIISHLYFRKEENYSLLIFFAGFAIFIKWTAIPLLLFLLPNLNKQYVQKTLLILSAFFILIFSKNIYQTAYPFYPFFKNIHLNIDYKTPENLISIYQSGIETWNLKQSYHKHDIELTQSQSLYDKLILAIQLNSIKQWSSLIILFLALVYILISMINWFIHRTQKEFDWSIFALNISLISWGLFAPQIRLGIPLFTLYLSYVLYNKSNRIKVKFSLTRLQMLSVILISICILSFQKLPKWSNTSAYLSNAGKVSIDNIITPFRMYHFSEQTSLNINGQIYLHPKNNIYCWDTKIPCMSKTYYHFIHNEFNMDIFLRTDKIKDGFKLKILQ